MGSGSYRLLVMLFPFYYPPKLLFFIIFCSLSCFATIVELTPCLGMVAWSRSVVLIMPLSMTRLLLMFLDFSCVAISGCMPASATGGF